MKIFKHKVLFIIFSILLVTATAAVFNVMVKPVYAVEDCSVFNNFLSYGGSDNFYYADVYYDELINGVEISTAQIKLERTKLQDGYWNKISLNVNITLITPSSTTYKKIISKDDTSVVLFDGSYMDEDGIYTVQASGTISAGATVSQNKSFTFIVDKTAPLGTLSGVSNRGFTTNNVQFTWDENGATATLNGHNYYKNAVISNEGTHIINLKDVAGNISTYIFTIDRTPPIGVLSGVSNKGFTNNDVTFSWTENYLSATLNGNYYNNGSLISVEGVNEIRLTDRAGNTTTYTFTLDKTPPLIYDYEEYTSDLIDFCFKDDITRVDFFQYRKEDGDIITQKIFGQNNRGTIYTEDQDDNGVWEICVTDICGNTSEWVQIKFAYRNTFGNSDIIYNKFFNPAFYKVTLSQKNYPMNCGTFEFAKYEAALNFAIDKEWDCRVIVLNGGEEWNYVTASNENARTIYTDRAELDAVIYKYARANISERYVLGKNGIELKNPTDENGITRVDALTQQISTLPTVLNQYSSERFMLVSVNYCFSAPTLIVEGNTTNLTIQFVSDGISLREGARKSIDYGKPLKSVVTEQGWYLVEETDRCGNLERYLIYVDIESPDITADVTYGNGDTEKVQFTEDYILENTETMRYLTFDIQSLTDNIDDYVMLNIDGRGLDSVTYISGDVLPILTYENGYYGIYAVSVYDRSLNLLEFTIYIAGEAPSLKYSSLTSDTSCTFTIQVNDTKNEIADVKIYKVFFDGMRETLKEDSFGTIVSADNLIYKMTVGGKYVFEFRDLYGRIVITSPIFYLKGLPTATLRGVRDGGITKNDVKVTYDVTCTTELSILKSGEWVGTDLFTVSEGIERNTLNITAGRDTSAVYRLLLYVTADRNLFTEYTFEIDGIPPEVNIKTASGGEVEQETVTTESFYVTWLEAGYSAWYRKGNAIADDVYTKDTVIRTAGTYRFTVLDAVRNELVFWVTLDNSVDYSLDGSTYTLLENGNYVTRGNFIFTVLEPWSLFDVRSSNGLTVVNGQKIDTDGTYSISVNDIYGNNLSLILIVDKLPPNPIITTESGRIVSSGVRINEAFVVDCDEENANITYTTGGGFTAYDGALLSEPGNYIFTLTDWVGNSIDVHITIDKMLAYSVNGSYMLDENGRFISKSWLSITLKEEMQSFYIMSDDGTEYAADKRISTIGEYKAYMRDTSGNEITLWLIIDKTPPTIEIVGVENGVAVDGAVTVRFTDYANAYYRRNDGDKIAITSGTILVNEGTYTVTALDFVGNAISESFAIDKSVDVTPSRELVDGQIIAGAVSFSFGENVTATLTMGDVQSSYSRGAISEPGEYALVVVDDYGNSKTYRWYIVAPKAKAYVLPVGECAVEVNRDGNVYSAEIDGDMLNLAESGSYSLIFRNKTESWALDIEVDNSAPAVQIENTGKSVKIYNPNKEGLTYTLYRDGKQVSFEMSSSAELTAKGNYRLVCTDEVGNVTEYTFSLAYMGNVTIVLIAVVSVLVLAAIITLVVIRLRHKKY